MGSKTRSTCAGCKRMHNNRKFFTEDLPLISEERFCIRTKKVIFAWPDVAFSFNDLQTVGRQYQSWGHDRAWPRGEFSVCAQDSGSKIITHRASLCRAKKGTANITKDQLKVLLKTFDVPLCPHVRLATLLELFEPDLLRRDDYHSVQSFWCPNLECRTLMRLIYHVLSETGVPCLAVEVKRDLGPMKRTRDPRWLAQAVNFQDRDRFLAVMRTKFDWLIHHVCHSRAVSRGPLVNVLIGEKDMVDAERKMVPAEKLEAIVIPMLPLQKSETQGLMLKKAKIQKRVLRLRNPIYDWGVFKRLEAYP